MEPRQTQGGNSRIQAVYFDDRTFPYGPKTRDAGVELLSDGKFKAIARGPVYASDFRVFIEPDQQPEIIGRQTAQSENLALVVSLIEMEKYDKCIFLSVIDAQEGVPIGVTEMIPVEAFARYSVGFTDDLLAQRGIPPVAELKQGQLQDPGVIECQKHGSGLVLRELLKERIKAPDSFFDDLATQINSTAAFAIMPHALQHFVADQRKGQRLQ